MVPVIDWNAPTAQSRQADLWFPDRLTDFPVAQAVHWLVPVCGAIVPSTQSTHTLCPAMLWYWAALQLRQTDAPV